MFKKLLMLLTVAVMLIGCDNKQEANNPNTEQQSTTKNSHEHMYTESITKEATCTDTGVKTFTCECGDTYTESIEATGHIYGDYVSNNDATYTADGTETATCVCGLTDTRTASGSKLEYTYTDLNKTMYAKSTVNVRSLPSTDGDKLGGLSKTQEVAVTGQCNETSWYRINYNNGIAYVSSDYLVNDKPVEETPAPSQPVRNWYDGYERYVWYDMGEYFFIIVNTQDEVIPYTNSFPYHQTLQERYPDRAIIQNGSNIITSSYSVALVSALHMDPERGFPIWSIDYLWN